MGDVKDFFGNVKETTKRFVRDPLGTTKKGFSDPENWKIAAQVMMGLSGVSALGGNALLNNLLGEGIGGLSLKGGNVLRGVFGKDPLSAPGMPKGYEKLGGQLMKSADKLSGGPLGDYVDITGGAKVDFAFPKTGITGGITKGATRTPLDFLPTRTTGIGTQTGIPSGFQGIIDRIVPDKYSGIVGDVFSAYQTITGGFGGDKYRRNPAMAAYDEYLASAGHEAERLTRQATQEVGESMAGRGLSRSSLRDDALTRAYGDIMGRYGEVIGRGALEASAQDIQASQFGAQQELAWAELISRNKYNDAALAQSAQLAAERGELDLFLKQLELEVGKARADALVEQFKAQNETLRETIESIQRGGGATTKIPGMGDATISPNMSPAPVGFYENMLK